MKTQETMKGKVDLAICKSFTLVETVKRYDKKKNDLREYYDDILENLFKIISSNVNLNVYEFRFNGILIDESGISYKAYKNSLFWNFNSLIEFIDDYMKFVDNFIDVYEKKYHKLDDVFNQH